MLLDLQTCTGSSGCGWVLAEVLIPISANPVDFDALYEAGDLLVVGDWLVSFGYVEVPTLPSFLADGWLPVREIPQKGSLLAIGSFTLRRS